MKMCNKCKVLILDHTVTCPLCKRVLVEVDYEWMEYHHKKNEKDESITAFTHQDLADASYESMYPMIEFDVNRYNVIKKLFIFLLTLLALTLAFINYITYNGVVWSIIAVLSIIYFAITITYSIMNQANLAAKILVQTTGGAILVVVIDYVIGYKGWSVNYAVPGMILFSNLAIVLLIIVNRMNFVTYLMYQFTMTILSFIPLVLIFFHIIHNPLLSYATSVISILILTATFIFGDKNVKNEIIRRFHS